MAIAIQIIGVIFIIVAVVVFITRNKRSETRASVFQIILAVFQVILYGFFFALCLSDILDINVNFSYVRFILNIFYIAAFLAITVFTFFNKKKEELKYIKGVVWTYIVLIPLNYTALFMRPILFASLALVYRAWLDRRERT